MPKILFLLEDYNHFYSNEGRKLIESDNDYRSTLMQLFERKYYQSDSLANALRELGNETEIIIPEANPLQKQWLKENNWGLYLNWIFSKPIRSFKARILKQHRTAYNSIQFKTVVEQVKKFKPDVIYYYSNIIVTRHQIAQLKQLNAKVVLQWSCPIWKEQPNFPYASFDLIITAALQLKEYFEKKGYKTLYVQQAFDETVLEKLEQRKEYKGEVLFIGGFSLGHDHRFEVLESLLRNNIDLTVHGLGKDLLPENSLLRNKMKGPLYGLEMYKEYQNYRMAIHINTTGNANDGLDWNKYAGAKRIFEITGAGALLLTSHQENINNLFEIGKEVVTFKNVEDLIEKINYYHTHQQEAEEIAKNGMRRTLKDHSFRSRARELNKVLFN